MKLKQIIIVIIITVLCSSFTVSAQKCFINGNTIGIDSKSIILTKPGEDLRYDGLEIPIENGKIEYELNIDQPQGYELFLGEAKYMGGRFMCIFLEPGKINITLHPEKEFDKNIVSGGQLNAEYQKLKYKLDSIEFKVKPISDRLMFMYDNGSSFSDSMKIIQGNLKKANTQDELNVLYKKIENLQNAGLDLTPEANKLREIIHQNQQEMLDFQQDYINKNPTIVSYFLLYQNLLMAYEKMDIAKAKNSYKVLSAKFPLHPYTNEVEILLGSIAKIHPGGKYIDFSAPDLDGKIFRLSELIDGKVALIDLWATWCGPCIAKSRKMVPVYQEFKDSGFVVVGVAGEFKNTDNLTRFLKKEKYPWLNLVELDRQNNIWAKYGIPNAGGGIFLVDRNGTILAVDPTAEEVKAKLKVLLK